MDAIAISIGYDSYSHFEQSARSAVNKILDSCRGTWLSYVRCNSGNPDVLVSPVEIYSEGRSIRMKLQGKIRLLDGELKLKGKCIHCLLESESEKSIYLVFKIGLVESPEVLQGVFCGISSGEDPISGREVLVRQETKYGTLKNRKVPIEEFLRSASEEEVAIGKYFRKKDGNILKIERASTFTLGDLIS
jgi:hypothetical protein